MMAPGFLNHKNSHTPGSYPFHIRDRLNQREGQLQTSFSSHYYSELQRLMDYSVLHHLMAKLAEQPSLN
jgi:hypothetical protein